MSVFTWELDGGFPTGLPDSVLERVEMPPPTRLVMQVLRETFGDDLYITPRIPLDSLNRTITPPRDPMVLVRKAYPDGYVRGDPRFVGVAPIELHVFSTDPNGETKGYLISEACRVALREATTGRPGYYRPRLGTLSSVRMLQEPTRKSDWANSTGPVQYADLPSGTWRTESVYRVTYRRDTEGGA